MAVDLKQLNSLLAVAEHGSFTAAARAIHTVQSNVSTHVARLEQELGVTLVDRGSGNLTDEGEAAVARARRIQAELDALEADVAAVRDVVVGQVRIGVIGSVGRWLVPDLLDTVGERHPGVQLVVVDATTTSLLPRLLDGNLDLAVVNLPVSEYQIVTTPLFEEAHILVAPTDHPLAAYDEVTLADVTAHRLVLEPVGTAFRDELDQAASASGLELLPEAEVDGMTLVASLAVRGHGPAVLPATATLLEPPGAWVRIPIMDLGRRAVGLARRRAGRLAAPARAVRTVLEELVRHEAARHDGVHVQLPPASE